MEEQIRSAQLPSSAEEGVAATSTKYRGASFNGADGVVLVSDRLFMDQHHPVCAEQGRFAPFFIGHAAFPSSAEEGSLFKCAINDLSYVGQLCFSRRGIVLIIISAMPNKSGGPVAASVIADLAAASRILAAQGVVDAFGHVSMRHPAAPDRYLMARSVAPALVTPDDILEYDLDSNALNANGRGSFLERFIHGEIYKARPDIHSVVHSHSPSVIPFGLVRA